MTAPLVPAADVARLVESGPFGYISSTRTGTIERVNATLAEWLGYDRSELAPRVVQDLLSPGDRIYYDTHLRPLLHMGGSISEIAVEFVRKDGSRLPALINAQLVGEAPSDGHPDGRRIETIVIDATARRTYERELLYERELAEQSKARLEFMYDLMAGFAAASTVDEVQAVVNGAGASPFTDVVCNMWLIGRDHRSATRTGSAGGDAEVLFDADTGGDAIALLSAGEFVVIDDPGEAAAQFPMIAAWVAGAGMASAVIAPLRDGGDLFGVLSVGSTDPHVFDDQERRAIASLALQTEQALRRTRLSEARELAQSRLERLHSFGRSLAATTAVDDVVDAIRRCGSELLGAADVRVALLDDSGTGVILLGGPGEALRPTTTVPLDRPSIAAAAIKQGVVVQVETRDHLVARYPASPILANTTLERVLAAPLRSGGDIIGAWVLGFGKFAPVDDSDDTVMTLFADEAGQALRRATSIERQSVARRRSDRRRMMSEALNGAVTTHEVGDALIGSGRGAFNAEGLAVLLVDDERADSLVLMSHAGLTDEAVAAMSRVDASRPSVRSMMNSANPMFASRPSEVADLLRDPFDVGLWGAAAVLPIGSAGQSIGLIALLYRSSTAFDDDARVALSGVAAEISVAMNRARTYDVEHEIAVTLQRSLLSFDVPQIDGWSIDPWYAPAHRHLTVGGDLFDVSFLDDGRIVVLVGDVVGHGLSAAASLGQLRSAAKALSLGGPRPAALLERIDEFARLTPGLLGSSLCCAVIRPDGVGSYACAGHPFPILVHDGDATVLRDGRSSLLGVGSSDRVDAEFVMRPGSSLVLYTDGVVERRVENLDDGIERLRALVEHTSFAAAAGPAFEIGTTMVSEREQVDDAVVVCVTRHD